MSRLRYNQSWVCRTRLEKFRWLASIIAPSKLAKLNGICMVLNCIVLYCKALNCIHHQSKLTLSFDSTDHDHWGRMTCSIFIISYFCFFTVFDIVINNNNMTRPLQIFTFCLLGNLQFQRGRLPIIPQTVYNLMILFSTVSWSFYSG